MKCKDCQYLHTNPFKSNGKEYTISIYELTHLVVKPDVEGECEWFNTDLSDQDICYNCCYYIGGGDWGLFCPHKDNYHHLGKFNDKPCKHYERRINYGSNDSINWRELDVLHGPYKAQHGKSSAYRVQKRSGTRRDQH